jgi:hypothetical protein
MRKAVLTILATSLIVGSAVQIAAAERYTHKSERARGLTNERFRNTNGFVASPSAEQQDWSDFSEGHVISAPAGH